MGRIAVADVLNSSGADAQPFRPVPHSYGSCTLIRDRSAAWRERMECNDGVVPQMIGLTDVAGTTQDFPTEEKRRRHNPKSNPPAACAFTLCGQMLSVRQVAVHERHRPLPLRRLRMHSALPIHAGRRPQRKRWAR
jgi:hypothetical protein